MINSRNGGADHPVGYCEPPKASRFQKGRSGNPGGGSKKVRARKADANGSPFDSDILDEVRRMVTVTEDGQRTRISASRAISRGLTVDAIKGNRSARKLLIDQLQVAHERQQALAFEQLGLLLQYIASQRAIQGGSSAGGVSEPLWPHPDDVLIDYTRCTARVVGPIDAQQAQPFIVLVGESRVWRARLHQLQAMADQTSGGMREDYGVAIGAIENLVGVIRDRLPLSFRAQLEWEDDEVRAGALDIEGPTAGETINLALISPDGNESICVLPALAGSARTAAAGVRGRTKLTIADNTTSLINRLQIERQARNGGAPPAPAVPEFAAFYKEFAPTSRDVDVVDELAG
jgi:hypothetical protein